MFAIVISEKGGAERREAFNQTEISVGRVQGNELMLPKGNVSKKHARLLFRDGRFIVTDLNSTNGTYVNRRRISQATIVREGDRIYIGDFVLRIEVPEKSVSDTAGSGQVERATSEPTAGPAADGSGVSHYPLERDPDESGSYPEVPGAPRVPSVGSVPSSAGASAPAATHSVPELSRTGERTGPVDSVSEEARAYRGALRGLVDRVLKEIDLAPLDSGEPASKALEKSIRDSVEDHASVMRNEGALPADVDHAKLIDDAAAEILELGSLRELIDDPAVTEIAVASFDTVVATRDGRRSLVEPPFSSDVTLRRAVARLARTTGAPVGEGESVVVRNFGGGSTLSAVRGADDAGGTMLTIEKAHAISSTLESLVRNGTISRGMATFFQCLVAGRANLLVVGPRDSSTSLILAALVGASDGQLVAVQGAHDVVGDRSAANRVRASATEQALRAVEIAGRMPDVRLVVDHVDGRLGGALLDAIGHGSEGVIAAHRGGNLRRALSRLPADIVAAGSVHHADAARETLAASFDIAIEVSRLRDGRDRVLRVVELAGTSQGEVQADDVFSFTVERRAAGGAVEGTFHASGRVPRIADEISARGIQVESSLFTRPPSR